MTKEKKLEKIFKLALDRGFKLKGWDSLELMLEVWPERYEWVIFSHPFLKCYFGEKNLGHCSACLRKFGSWQYHAQQLVLSKDRIQYLWENRGENERK